MLRRLRLALPGVSLLDVKLAARMLGRQPGLTIVAVFALAIGIPVGLLPMHVLSSLGEPLPVAEGERVVMVRNYDRLESDAVSRPLHDFVQWRQELSSFSHLAMWRTDMHNVGSDDGWTAPLQGAEVSASFFPLLGVAPLMGRPLGDADEVIGAPDVVVIGHRFWQTRLGGDPDVLGSTIRIGAAAHTVVGVMPDDFRFPYRDELWIPLRYDPLAYERGSGPSGIVMGRLAVGVTIEDAQREADIHGRRMAAAFPDTHENLVPQVLHYTRALTGIDGPEAKLGIVFTQILAFFLLVLACGNVGVLVLARVATRTTEIAVRTALGASRGRILSQLFIESLLLAVLGAGTGLIVLQAIATGPDFLLDGLPFWVSFEVSLQTAALAMTLAIVSAVIAGVVPAIKATSKDVRSSIQRTSVGGSGIRFGRGYSTLIIGEVAVAILFLVFGWSLVPSLRAEPGGLGIPTEEYLHASLHIPRVDQTGSGPQGDERPAARIATLHRELVRRLSAEPGVGAVAIGSTLPGTSHATRFVEIEGMPRAPGSPAPAHLVNVAQVDVGFFEALGQPILNGRGFDAADLGERRTAVVVNTSFVERVLGGRNPIGLRIRYWSPERESGPWSYEIVGVVGRLGMNALHPDVDEGIYHVAAPGELHPLTFAVRVPGDPQRFTPRLRSIVAEIDAEALVRDPMTLANVPDPNRHVLQMSTYLVVLLAVIAMVLAAACLYALMSFTVTERRRESAIRVALGAQRASIVITIGRRVLFQLGVGVVIGAVLSAGLLSLFGSTEGGVFRTANWPASVGAIAALMIAVGMLACVKPTLRAIRIQPAEALKG